ncbi:glycosyltransferase family 2 protein [Leptospira noguchii]|uniref:Glycosyltransferase, group 2 family protein n=1 Tax=Leptospira noguchii serovar Panama str. CZ214 TaxID=1001595 RepID=T0GKZ3_9LEPT|nr:glycosyltransferase family 2 protein [Leptospira noguchii]EQA69552.1 glycosyltransferase, group 2 family protein [Leptospira noguchii serovar Panama str. CZ214]
MRKKKLVSIVIPVYNEEDNVRIVYDAIQKVILNEKQYDFEIIFTDNHSQDSTFECLKEIAAIDSNIKVLRFNRNYGFQSSLLMGYRATNGDAVIQIDCDLQDPPEMISTFLKFWKQGHDVVVGIRRRRIENFLLTWARRIFYAFILKVSEEKISRDAGDFRLIDRTVLNKIILLNENQPYIRGLVSAFSVNEIGVEYDRFERKFGKSKFPIRKLLGLAIDGIFSMSLLPLRLAGYISSIIALTMIALGSYYFIAAIFFGSSWPSGFATIVLLLLFSISLNAIFLAIIGKYLGRIYIQLQNRPLVVIESSINIDKNFEEKVIRKF